MGAADAMLARLQAELEERTQFQDGLVQGAQDAKRDLNSQEMELFNRAATRIGELEAQLDPLREGARIAQQSRQKTAELAAAFSSARGGGGGGPAVIEYRSAGAYIADMYHARLGDADAQSRIEIFHRVAAHQTTSDNPGLLPEQIVGPIVNFVDASRPLVTAIGAQDLGNGSWSYARVTQHTQVGKQAGEKTELPSRKLVISKTPIGGDSYGGYVNISQQDIRRTSPAIVDQVVNDLAGEYAIETEAVAAGVVFAAAVAGPTLPTNPTALNISSALWGAAGAAFAAVKGQGRLVLAVSPDMLGMVGPLFPGINPQNAVSTGMEAAGFNSGQQGVISGFTVVMSAGLAAGSIVTFSTAAVKAFEYRYGNLQVVEPSVWGLQVGYAGDFQTLVVEPNAVIKIGHTP